MKEATNTGLYGVGQTLSEKQILALTRHRGTTKEKENHNTIVPALLGIEPNII